MKKMYFGGVSKSIKSWIEKNGKLEFDVWKSDEEILRNKEGLFYTDMPFILQKLINDMMKAGLAISDEMRKPIFSVLVQETQQIRQCLFDFITQLSIEMGTEERFFNCLFSTINNTISICEHFKTAKVKFTVDDVEIERVHENMDGLAKNVIHRFIIDDVMRQLDEERDEITVDDDQEAIEIKWSDLISDRWFAAPDPSHVQLFFNVINNIIEICQDGMSSVYFDYLVTSLDEILITGYIKQVISKRVDLTAEDEEDNLDKRQKYASKMKQDVEVIDNDQLTAPLLMIAKVIELECELLPIELPKLFGQFRHMTV